MHLNYRAALPGDAADCVAMRGKTRENAFTEEQLRSIGITAKSWGDNIASGALAGHVCTSGGNLVGYSFGSRATGEIEVVAILPEFEGRGIGRELLERTVQDLVAFGHRRVFLGCSTDPGVRSHGFYRHLGWRATGTHDDRGDEILELLIDP